MPGHTNSPYWAAVDFDSEEEDDKIPQSNQRLYLDPWDNDAFGTTPKETSDSSQGDHNMSSFSGEPVTASFYYVPTKTCDSGDYQKTPKRTVVPEDLIASEYPIYSRRLSRNMMPEYDVPIYCHKPVRERRRSVYVDEPMYAPHPMLYESVYAPLPLPPPGYMYPRQRMSLQHHPDFMIANRYPRPRRHSRMADTYEPIPYETMPPEYEDWARPMTKTTPENFHLSKYGHLRIDYSCSWNSLDRIIRNH